MAQVRNPTFKADVLLGTAEKKRQLVKVEHGMLPRKEQRNGGRNV